MVQHKQSFWAIDVGTGDIGATKRAQIAKAACWMNDHPDIILATSCGGRTTSTDSEVALVTLASYDVEPLGPLLRQALSDQGLPVEIHLKDNVRYHDFDQFQLDMIAHSCKADSREKLYQAIDQLAALPLSSEPELIPPRSRSDLAGSDGPPFSVNEVVLQHLKRARGAEVESIIRRYNNAFFELEHETNDNVMVATMVASGIITVGKAMYQAYGLWTLHGSLSVIISGVLSSIGGAAMVLPIVAVVASIFSLVFFALKDEANVLLFANATKLVYSVTNDFLLTGIRKRVVLDFPPAGPSSSAVPTAYPCGIFIYTKTSLPNLFGSCMGIRFWSDKRNTSFAVGMDSPNLGRNSIYVVGDWASDSSAANAAGFAYRTATDTMELKGSGQTTCTVSRAASWGNINFGIAVVTSD